MRLATCVALTFVTNFALAADFYVLNRDPETGPFPLRLEALADNGSVVVGKGPPGPVMWTKATGLVGIPSGESFSSGAWHWATAAAVSADGSVIAGWGEREDGSEEGFRWTAETGPVPIGRLTPTPAAWGSWGWVNTISDDGSAIGGTTGSPNGSEAFLWTAQDGIRGLGDLPGGEFRSTVNAMSADAQTLFGGATSERGWEAVKWSGATGPTAIPSVAGSVFEVSKDGSVMVGYVTHGDEWEAYRWTADGGKQGLGDFPSGKTQSVAIDLTADGTIIGDGEIGDQGGSHSESFIWDEFHGLRSMTDVMVKDFGLVEILSEGLVGGRLSHAIGISDDGKVLAGWNWVIDLHEEQIPGDSNFDHVVDLGDFGVLKNHFGKGVWRNQGDFNDDDRVDLSDFGLLKANFGRTVAVPEPSCAIGLVVGCLAMAIAGRVRQSHTANRNRPTC